MKSQMNNNSEKLLGQALKEAQSKGLPDDWTVSYDVRFFSFENKKIECRAL